MLSNLLNFTIVFIGGGIGASLRYLVSIFLKSHNQPYGILCINIAGSFLIGIISNYILKNSLDDRLKLLLVTGVLGGLTTFSTFSFETIKYLDNGNIVMALMYPALSLFLSFLACYIGYKFLS